MKTNTLRNLYTLVENKVLTTNSIAIFLFCALEDADEWKSIPVQRIQKRCQISSTNVRSHLQMMQDIGIMQIDRKRGRPLKIKLNEITEQTVKEIVNDSSLLSSLSAYRDSHINKYNAKSYIVNINNIRGEESDQVKLLFELLPSEYRSFRVTPKYKRALAKLEDIPGFRFRDYVEWFIKNKLGVTVASFGLGILVCQSMVIEYRQKKRMKDKNDKYKRVESRKDSFEEAARQFEEEMDRATNV